MAYFQYTARRFWPRTRTRLNSEFSLPQPRTELGKQSIRYAGVKIWSEIPPDIKTYDKLQIFSDKFKSHVLQKYPELSASC